MAFFGLGQIFPSTFGARRGIFSSLMFTCCPVLGSSSAGALPLNLGPSCGKKTVVLDIDETLIHSFSRRPSKFDFMVKLEDETYYVRERPYVREFLDKLQSKFEVVFFTASMDDYADQIIDRLAPQVPRSHRFYRTDCTIRNGCYVKDLSRLNRRITDIVLVDNSPVSYSMQQANGIPVVSWEGQNNDAELTKTILPILMELENAKDVRTIVKEKFSD